MTIQQLRHFLAVCSELNYTRAAAKCFLSRQALRQSIASLEEELKCSLFYMEANKLSLTVTGELLQQRALPIVRDFSRLEEEMLSGTQKRQIRLGISLSLIPDYLPHLSENLRSFCERNPTLQIEPVHLKNDELEKAVLEGGVDCGLILDMRSCSQGLERTELSAHPISLLVAKGNALGSRSAVTSAEVSDTVLCVPGTGPAFSPVTAAFGNPARGNEIRIIESFYQAYYMVREQNAAAMNRYIAGEGIDLSSYVSNVIISDLPPICSSFICSGTCGEELTRLKKYLSREIGRYFAGLDALPPINNIN